jgi:hypothetical protein
LVEGRLTGMVLSFGYLILRQTLQLTVLGMRGERSKEAELWRSSPFAGLRTSTRHGRTSGFGTSARAIASTSTST